MKYYSCCFFNLAYFNLIVYSSIPIYNYKILVLSKVKVDIYFYLIHSAVYQYNTYYTKKVHCHNVKCHHFLENCRNLVIYMSYYIYTVYGFHYTVSYIYIVRLMVFLTGNRLLVDIGISKINSSNSVLVNLYYEDFIENY